MPSPFPGMDPYLEGSEWVSVHIELSAEIARQLAPKVRPKYIVRTARRFVTEMPEDIAVTRGDMYPDVSVVDTALPQGKETGPVAVAPTPLQLATVMPSRVPHVSIEIRDVAQRELVTAIEILSPSNKRGEGYQEYLNKRHRILLSTAHLIEIDLLRQGRRVPMQQPLPTAPYFIFLSRAERRPLLEVWPIQLPMRLPVIPVPLLADDPDVPLDIQLALTTVYDTFNYDLSVDYTRPADVLLAGDAAVWAAEQLRQAGIVTRTA
jgi:Protein of unknown function (DUF4058)